MDSGVADASRGPVRTVRGHAMLEVQPELASVLLSVTAREKTRPAALRELAKSVDAVRRMLAEYATERIDESALSVYVTTVKRRSESCVASMRLTAVFASFDDLGDRVLRAGEHASVGLSGPHWSLRPTSPTHLEAKRRAIANARATAEAAGGRLTALVEISDVVADLGLRPTAPRGGTPDAARGAVADEITFDLTPQIQRPVATVMARYAMTAPAL